MLGDLLTVNAYDKSEHTFNFLDVLLTVNTYDNSERTFIVLGDLELELIQPQMAQKPMLRGEVGARAWRV